MSVVVLFSWQKKPRKERKKYDEFRTIDFSTWSSEKRHACKIDDLGTNTYG